MVLSHLFIRHKKSQPRFAPALFVTLLALFVVIGQEKPLIGLVGIGTTVVITGVLVELNRDRIWESYRKVYRKRQGFKGLWTEPNHVYYTINVLFLWPFVIFLGVLCLFAAYMLA